MNEGYAQFVNQLEQAIITFPSLSISVSGDKKVLNGTLPVVDKDEKHWDDYDIEIHCHENFPYRFPMLFETSGKIPKIADWHVYEDTGSCCVKILPEEILRCKKGITVTEYIREEVVPYLFNQTHRRVEGYYINGEYGHGVKGIYEYYADILGTGDDRRQTLKLLLYISTHTRPSRTSLCFCGGKSKFRHCHRDAFDKLKNIGDNTLIDHANLMARAAKLI